MKQSTEIMHEPSILVVMPVFNAENFLQPAIESILNQTFSDFRFLIIDDGSTDRSVDIIMTYKDRRIIFKTQLHQGLGSILNLAMQYAINENIPFIARMDADDVSCPERLMKQINFMNNHPEIAACSCNCDYINTQGEIIGSSTVPLTDSLIRWELKNGMRGMVHGSILISVKALADVGGYREQFIQAEDADLFFRLSERYKLANLPQYLYQIRLHHASRSVNETLLSIQYMHYAKNCYLNRKMGKTELTFRDFLNKMRLVEKLAIKREYYLLGSWRLSLLQKNFGSKIIAALLDPKRVIARFLRLAEMKANLNNQGSEIRP